MIGYEINKALVDVAWRKRHPALAVLRDREFWQVMDLSFVGGATVSLVANLIGLLF